MDYCFNCVFIEAELRDLLDDQIDCPPNTNTIAGSFIHKAMHVLMEPTTSDDTKVQVSRELKSYLNTQYIVGDSYCIKEYNAILVVLPNQVHMVAPNDLNRQSIYQALTMRAKYVQPPMLHPVDIKHCRMREERLGVYYAGMLMVSAPFAEIAQLLDYLDPQ